MEKFDLELAKQGHPVQTRDGRPARIICFDRKDEEFPLVVLIGDKTEEAQAYTLEGKFHNQHPCESVYDLFMAHCKIEGWVNIYRDSNGDTICKFHYNKADALLLKSENCIATTKIEWEE